MGQFFGFKILKLAKNVHNMDPIFYFTCRPGSINPEIIILKIFRLGSIVQNDPI